MSFGDSHTLAGPGVGPGKVTAEGGCPWPSFRRL